MRKTVEVSPFYSGWLQTVEGDLEIAKEAIQARDFQVLGEVMEANCEVHATMLEPSRQLYTGKVEPLRLLSIFKSWEY